MKTYGKGDLLECPHCGNTSDFDGEVENFVIPGTVGEDSRYTTECDDCRQEFTCMMSDDGSYVVEKA